MWTWLLLLLVVNCLLILYWYQQLSMFSAVKTNQDSIHVIYNTTKITNGNYLATRKWTNCSINKCLDLRKCVYHRERRLSIYIQPLLNVVDQVCCYNANFSMLRFLIFQMKLKIQSYFIKFCHGNLENMLRCVFHPNLIRIAD